MRDLVDDDIVWIIAQAREICRFREILYRLHGKTYDHALGKVVERAE